MRKFLIKINFERQKNIGKNCGTGNTKNTKIFFEQESITTKKEIGSLHQNWTTEFHNKPEFGWPLIYTNSMFMSDCEFF